MTILSSKPPLEYRRPHVFAKIFCFSLAGYIGASSLKALNTGGQTPPHATCTHPRRPCLLRPLYTASRRSALVLRATHINLLMIRRRGGVAHLARRCHCVVVLFCLLFLRCCTCGEAVSHFHPRHPLALVLEGATFPNLLTSPLFCHVTARPRTLVHLLCANPGKSDARPGCKHSNPDAWFLAASGPLPTLLTTTGRKAMGLALSVAFFPKPFGGVYVAGALIFFAGTLLQSSAVKVRLRAVLGGNSLAGRLLQAEPRRRRAVRQMK